MKFSLTCKHSRAAGRRSTTFAVTIDLQCAHKETVSAFVGKLPREKRGSKANMRFVITKKGKTTEHIFGKKKKENKTEDQVFQRLLIHDKKGKERKKRESFD